MKKRIPIILTVLILILTVCLLVACNPDEPAEQPKAKYTITFDTDGGDARESITATEGADISTVLPADPTKSGVFFGGWAKSKGFSATPVELPTAMPSEDVTYYARWVYHFTVVPNLQNTERTGYAPDASLGVTHEGDPAHPNIDLYDYAPVVPGFNDVSTPDEHDKTLTAKDSTFYLNYDRKLSHVTYDANLQQAVGAMSETDQYCGLDIKLPENGFIPPVGYRFAGWSAYADGRDVKAAGSTITVAGEGAYSGNFTLYAIWDKAYIDYSYGYDYVYIPRLEEGKAYLEKAQNLLTDTNNVPLVPDEYEGTFDSETNTFAFWTDANTLLEGKVYEDGHFAYRHYDLTTAFATEYELLDLYTEEIDSSSIMKIDDMYGGATLTLGSDIQAVGYFYSNDMMMPDLFTVEAGVYTGGYWVDSANGDFCFTMLTDEDGVSVQLDIHFNIYRQTQSDGTDARYFALRGKEWGIYVEGLDASGYATGDIVLLDGYGGAVNITTMGSQEMQLEGYYGIYFDEYCYLEVENEIFMSSPTIKMTTEILGINSMLMPFRLFELGDSRLFGLYADEDGNELFLNGFGGFIYTDSNGNTESGETEIPYGADEPDGYAMAVTCELSSGAVTVIIDQYTGEFILVDGNVKIGYVYTVGDGGPDVEAQLSLMGAIVSQTDGTAYYLSAGYNFVYSTIFTDIVSGTLTKNANVKDAYVFEGDNGYHMDLEFQPDVPDPEESGLPQERLYDVYTTDGITINDITYDVLNIEQGQQIGRLYVNSDGTAKYTDAGNNTHEYKSYVFDYSAIFAFEEENCEGEPMVFVIESMGNGNNVAYWTDKYSLLSGLTHNEIGVIYHYFNGGIMAFLNGQSGEFEFYDHGRLLSDANSAQTGVYYISLPDLQLPVVGLEINFQKVFITASDLLLGGVFKDKTGQETLELDQFGFATYTDASGTKYTGTYGIDNVDQYRFTQEVEGGKDFTFIVDTTDANAPTFEITSYMIYIAVDASNYGEPIFILLVNKDNTATLYEAKESNDSLSGFVSGDKITDGNVVAGDDGVYTLTAGDKVYRYKIDTEFYSTFDIVVCESDKLTEGTYSTADESVTITLDKFGVATVNYKEPSEAHPSEQYVGIYQSVDLANGAKYLFTLEDADQEFAFNIEEGKLVVYEYDEDEGNEPVDPSLPTLPDGVDPKSEFWDVTYKGVAYKLLIDKNVKGYLYAKKGDEYVLVAKGDITQGDGLVFTFTATPEAESGLPDDFNGFKYQFEGDHLLDAADPDYVFTRKVMTGNYYLEDLVDNALWEYGTLTCDGFAKHAVFNMNGTSGSTTEINGSLEKRDDGDIVFTSESGSLRLRLFGDRFVEVGPEEGMAYAWFAVINSTNEFPDFYLDGLGKAYETDKEGNKTDTVFGLYVYSQWDDESIVLVMLDPDATSTSTDNVIGVYKTYDLARQEKDGSVTYFTGVVAYSPSEAGVIITDDWGVIQLDGYDEMFYFDSQGHQHSGNYMTTNGYEYWLTDEVGNMVIYFIDFDDLDASGLAHGYRVSYFDYTTGGELDIYSKDIVDGYMTDIDLPEGYDGYAQLYNEQFSEGISGYYTIEVDKESGVTIVTLHLLSVVTDKQDGHVISSDFMVDENGEHVTIEFLLYSDGGCEMQTA